MNSIDQYTITNLRESQERLQKEVTECKRLVQELQKAVENYCAAKTNS